MELKLPQLSNLSLSSLSFSKWRKHDAIGIDWGTKDLKWLKLKSLGKNQYEIIFLDVTPLPEKSEEKIAMLQEYVLKNKFKQMPVAVSFYDETFQARRMELPKMPNDDLLEAIRWQMRDLAEGSMDDYTVRHSLIEEKVLPDINRLTLLGMIMKKNGVQSHVQLLEKAGLSPFFIEPTPVSMAVSLTRLLKIRGEDKWMACIDIGLKRSYFLVVWKEALHFLRTLPDITLEQMTSEDYSTKLSVEIQQSLDLFSIAYPTAKIQKMFLAGGGTGAQNLPSLLATNVGIETEMFNPFVEVRNLEAFPKAAATPYLFGPAFGIASVTH